MLRSLLLCSVILALYAPTALACPNCKNAHVDSDDPEASERLREGYFWSYIGMTSMPFLAVGGIATMLFFSNRRQRMSADAAGLTGSNSTE